MNDHVLELVQDVALVLLALWSLLHTLHHRRLEERLAAVAAVADAALPRGAVTMPGKPRQGPFYTGQRVLILRATRGRLLVPATVLVDTWPADSVDVLEDDAGEPASTTAGNLAPYPTLRSVPTN